jgi:hypothetical protein
MRTPIQIQVPPVVVVRAIDRTPVGVDLVLSLIEPTLIQKHVPKKRWKKETAMRKRP